MKPGIIKSAVTSVIILLLVSKPAFPQDKIRSLRYQDEIWKVWTLDANAGALSFYGDLSSNDASFIDKLKYESRPALSFILTRHFNRLFGISGQFLLGQLHGNKENASFGAALVEYNLGLKFNLFNLFYPENKGNFGITGQAGLGQFIFSSEKTTFREGGNEITTHQSRVPEFVYFIGAGAFLKTNDRFGFTMNMSLRQCQNDQLDVLTTNNDYDYYSYLSAGVTYYFDSIKSKPLKNKARLAHTNVKLKSLSQ
jgi:hypothetical protein